VLYPALAGTFGALSVLFAKSVTEAVRLTAKGDNQLFQVQPYLMAGAMGGCVFLQLRYLNTSLTKAGQVVRGPVRAIVLALPWLWLLSVPGMPEQPGVNHLCMCVRARAWSVCCCAFPVWRPDALLVVPIYQVFWVSCWHLPLPVWLLLSPPPPREPPTTHQLVGDW
jgi:hypothetical protein